MKNWLKNAVFYEIYPQSFHDTNADGIGDFNGIIEKLDYIKDMGFTAIWMNPCYKSPFYDAGYDVEDYYSAAPRYGTNEDLKRLFCEAHKRGMRVILDLVPGHTAITCEWFKQSAKAEKNEYSDRYIWTDAAWEGCDGISGINGTLRGISDRDGCCAVNYYSTQPALNYGFAEINKPWQSAMDSEEAMSTRKAILDVIRFWLGMGCDGFRVDMAGSLVKNDKNQQETVKLWKEMFSEVSKEFPEAAFVSEWGEPDKALLGGYDMDFLLHFGPSHYNDLFRAETPYFSSSGKGTISEFFRLYTENLKKTNGKGLICLPSGNHDMERISYRLDDTQLKLAYAFIMSMPGVPFIYYGDEIGMKYLENIKSVEGGYNRTGSRSPMQWNDETNSGFSAAAPDMLYIPIDPNKDRPTVQKQAADEKSVLNELKRQITVRKSNEALQESAEFELVCDKYPLVYKRTCGNGSILVAINPSGKECECEVNAKAGKVMYEYNGAAAVGDGRVTVPPCSASYIEIF